MGGGRHAKGGHAAHLHVPAEWELGKRWGLTVAKKLHVLSGTEEGGGGGGWCTTCTAVGMRGTFLPPPPSSSRPPGML